MPCANCSFDDLPNLAPRYNLAPTQAAPVVRAENGRRDWIIDLGLGAGVEPGERRRWRAADQRAGGNRGRKTVVREALPAPAWCRPMGITSGKRRLAANWRCAWN